MKNLILIVLLTSIISCKEAKETTTVLNLEVMHPRVTWTENPAKHAIISWTSTQLGKENYVLYDTLTGLNSQKSLQTKSVKDGKISMREMDYTEGVPEGYFHHAELFNLMPSTTYYFKFCTDGICSDEFNFLTAPVQDIAFSIISGGDSRLGGEKPRYAGRTPHVERQEMNRIIASLTEEDPSVLAFAHGGDYCTTADWRHLYWWFEDHELTITKDKRILPLIIARGNHEHEIGFLENFWLGEISNENSDGYFFMTQLSPSAALITLNTETSMAGNQLEFLEETLEESRQDFKWMFTQYHKPAYPAVKDYDREDFYHVRRYWVPLFEQYKISMAWESDGHSLKKTSPLLDGKVNPEGIIYVGEGGLGVPQRKPDVGRWYFSDGSLVESAHHVWKIDVLDSVTHATAIGIKKDTLHAFSIPYKPYIIETTAN